MESQRDFFSVGHSNYAFEYFVDLLKEHNISILADVRFFPYSTYCPHFGREKLEQNLKVEKIKYWYLGTELGHPDTIHSSSSDSGTTYESISKTEKFKKGIERLENMPNGNRIAIMCAEKDPIDCHRMFWVSQELNKKGILVKHILSDGKLECHEDTMDRLINNIPEDKRRSQNGLPLPYPKEELVSLAIKYQENKINSRKLSKNKRSKHKYMPQEEH